MIKTIRIFHFNQSKQERLKFVRVIAENNDAIGLKRAKELQYQMLAGVPFVYELDSSNMDTFVKELDKLEVKYSVSDWF